MIDVRLQPSWSDRWPERCIDLEKVNRIPTIPSRLRQRVRHSFRLGLPINPLHLIGLQLFQRFPVRGDRTDTSSYLYLMERHNKAWVRSDATRLFPERWGFHLWTVVAYVTRSFLPSPSTSDICIDNGKGGIKKDTRTTQKDSQQIPNTYCDHIADVSCLS